MTKHCAFRLEKRGKGGGGGGGEKQQQIMLRKSDPGGRREGKFFRGCIGL